MQPKAYLIFHLNLAFSSIEEKERVNVIRTCYYPLLELIEQTGIPIGVELTGWTLKEIEQIDPSWIECFKLLLKSGQCELIGSGYCQIIAPLVPFSVNKWNQKLGLQEYERLLDQRPNIVLVNEMAYSDSLVELYAQFNYQGLIMDRDNVRLALGLDCLPMNSTPTHALGVDGVILPILWADSILFQKLQQYVHGDVAIADYLDYLARRISDGETLFPIYCNDAEVFDYRPGRFNVEKPIHTEGEWNRIHNLLQSVTTDKSIEWVSPTRALEINDQIKNHKVSCLTSAAHPIPVKKQAKYNITRWAVTGRDDLWLNTMCYRINQHLTANQNENADDWRELCELWASDLRTHINEERWKKAKNQLSRYLKRHHISDNFGSNPSQSGSYQSLENVIGHYGGGRIELDRDGIILRITNQKLELELNLRRGLTIKSLAFVSHGMHPSIGTLSHGYFSSITLGADYYSGGVIVELPKDRRRITDLEQVVPRFLLKKNGDIEVLVTIPTIMGDMHKIIRISSDKEEISLSYHFPRWIRPIGSIRLGTITFLPEFFDEDFTVSCSNGGSNMEEFNFGEIVDHGEPPSTLVSSSRGIGATNGSILINSNDKSLKLAWNPEDCAVMPMWQKKSSPREPSLFRIFFSMLESDETGKESDRIGSFNLKISI